MGSIIIASLIGMYLGLGVLASLYWFVYAEQHKNQPWWKTAIVIVFVGPIGWVTIVGSFGLEHLLSFTKWFEEL